MSQLLGELGTAGLNTIEETVGIAAGTAGHVALSPIAEAISQVAWSDATIKVPPALYLAIGVAQGKVQPDDAAAWAKKQGFDGAEWSALVQIGETGPGVAAAYELWRRDVIGEDGFRAAAKRQGIADEWIDDLVKIKQRKLDPADVARGIHRGLVADPGLLAAEPPTGVGNVPAYPVYPVDALDEAAAHGYDRDRLGVLVGLQGNPMGPHEAASAEFRGVLTHDDFLRAIAEGNTRNEWAEAIFEQTRQLPTARDFLENALRGYRTLDDAIAGAALHGMTQEHATMIYQNQGRPMALTSITKALARGGTFKPEPGEITDPYQASIVEGSLKRGYYDLAKHLIYVYPSAFFMRALVQSGDLSAEEFATYAKQQGWPPDLADKISKAIGGAASSGGDANVKKAQTQLWTTTHSSYVNHWITDAEATAALRAAGVADASIEQVLAVWRAERALRHAGLAAAQIRKAIGQAGKDEAWALGRLAELGWDADDAAAFLAE